MIQFSFSEKIYRTRRVIGDQQREVVNHAPKVVSSNHTPSPTPNDPILVFTGAIHGNEPSGVIALLKVFEELTARKIKLQGRMIGLTGNLQALPGNERFISKDLNRIWDHDFTERFHLRSSQSANNGRPATSTIDTISEYEEQIEIFNIMEPLMKIGAPIFFIDLHTTSSLSVPFIAINDQIANRNFALRFPVPTVLGIEEYLHGPLLSYLNDYGHVALAFEAGQHDDPESVRIHTSFIYLSMVAAGVIAKSEVLQFEEHRERLKKAGLANHGIFEVIFRHAIKAEDDFVMEDGFQNFDSIDEGQVLANDRNGPITAHTDARIFMPLYQNSGGEGFFLVRRVPMWALKLSSVLRKINFERVLAWLPGVSHQKEFPDALVVNKTVARFLAKELFHLLGYRRKKEQGNEMIFSRREIDHRYSDRDQADRDQADRDHSPPEK